MTEEQEEAIEKLENLCEYGLCYTINEEIQEKMKTVLYILTERDREIECNKMTHDCKECIKKYFERKVTYERKRQS